MCLIKTKESKDGLDKSIVKYTNSQNGIDEKHLHLKLIILVIFRTSLGSGEFYYWLNPVIKINLM